VILVFDLTDPDSLLQLEEFYDQAARAGVKQFVLVGSKCDEASKIANDEIQEFRDDRKNLPYIAVSAKMGININDLEIAIYEVLIGKYPTQGSAKNQSCILL
jgi:50S ribosomal subunit-associated GTPase HflX